MKNSRSEESTCFGLGLDEVSQELNQEDPREDLIPKKTKLTVSPQQDASKNLKSELFSLKAQADELWISAIEEEGFGDEEDTSLLDKPFELYQRCYQLIKQLRSDYSNNPIAYYYALKVIATAHYDLGYYVVAKQCFNEAVLLAENFSDSIVPYEKDLPQVIANIRHNIALCDIYWQLFGTLDEESVVSSAQQPNLSSALHNIIQHLISARINNRNKTFAINLTSLLVDIYQNTLGSNYPHITKELNSRDAKRIYWIIQDVLTSEQIFNLVFGAKESYKAIKSIEDFCGIIHPKLADDQLELIENFKVPLTDVDKLIQDVISRVSRFKEGGYFDKLQLKTHQLRTFESWEAHLKSGRNVGTFVKPTGTGKTRDFLSFTLATVDKNFKVLILVPSRALVYQTQDRLLELSKKIGKKISVSVLDNPRAKRADVDISTIALFNLEMKRPETKRRMELNSYKMVIRDEAHIGLNLSQKDNVEELAKSKIVLACTATPEYNTNRNKVSLKSLNQCYGESSQFFNYSLSQAIIDKQLSPVHVCLVTTDTGLRPMRSKDSRKSKLTQKEISENEAALLINHEKLNKVAIEIYMNCIHPDTGQTIFARQSVFFCAGIPHAKAMADTINKQLKDHPRFKHTGVTPAAYISGELDNASQREILEQFRKGKVAILCGSDILITGIDVPDIVSIFNLRPTKSNVLALQRFGRSIRLSQKFPEKTALVFEFNWIIDNQVFVMDFLNGQHRLGDIKGTFVNKERLMHLRRDDISKKDRIPGTSPWELDWQGNVRLQAVGVRRKDLGFIPSIAAETGALIEQRVAERTVPHTPSNPQGNYQPSPMLFFPAPSQTRTAQSSIESSLSLDQKELFFGEDLDLDLGLDELKFDSNELENLF